VCNSDILVGYRYHCDSCDIDFCERCLRYSGNKLHHHQLRPMPVTGSQQVKTLTEEQRRERQRSIQVHLQLLQHSSQCEGCKSRNCQKMKEFIKHGRTCPDGIKKGCHNCKRIYNLLQLHARGCRNDNCVVFKCNEIRAHLRNMAQRQQQMDDNRRQMMNKMYQQQGAT
jgi:E1A/CREB-binding protein